MSQPTDQEVMLGIFEDLASLENIFKNNAEAGNSGTVVVEEEEQIPSEGRSKTGGVRITISLPPSTPPESAGSKTSQSSSSNSSTTSSESTDISSLRRQADEMVSPPISIPSFNLPCCRISHDAHLDTHGRLIAPCLCEGSLKYVHEECLQRQIEIGQLRKCEVCQFEFERRICVKPKHEAFICKKHSVLFANYLSAKVFRVLPLEDTHIPRFPMRQFALHRPRFLVHSVYG
ncbi:hypothetical protein ECG_09238 [Echinococcus granulosus]|nr:hypothetical protein ECG_09238 [Echinococcus granulosus]